MIKVFDRIKEISTTDGTGNFKLEGALFGFRPFSSVYASGDYCYYTIVLDNNYEIGSGEYIFDGSNHWLSRFPIHSTNSNNLVNFSNGVKEVFVTYPAKYAVYSEKTMNSGNLAFWGAPNSLDSTNSLSWDGSGLKLNGVNVSVSGHTHTSNDILNFNQTVSGLLPVKNILAGSGVFVSSTSGVYTVNSTVDSVKEAASIVTNVFNKTANTITKGSVVYINGGQGDQPTIQLAIAINESGSSKTYGVVQSNIPSMSPGKAVVFGALNGLNTDQYNPTAPVGDVNGVTLWLSPSVSGAMTTTKPFAPNHTVSIGTIVRTHQNQGVVEVKIQNGVELEELHDVAISNVINGQFLQYNGASGLWVPTSSGNFSTLLIGGTPVSISGHVHTVTDITNFASGVSGLLPITNIVGGPNISVTTSGATYTIGVSGQLGLTAEQVDDRVANLLVAGTGIVLNYNDNGDILTINTSGLQPSGNYSVVGHTHTSSDITNFNAAVSNLLPGVTNSGDNRVLTSDGSTSGIVAESNLTFDGTKLSVTGDITVDNLTLDLNTIVSSSGNLVIAPAVSGALVASTTGNARGANAVDLQTARSQFGGNAQVSSGACSVIGGGSCNTASGGCSVVAGGTENRAIETYSTVGGGFANRADGFMSTVGGGFGHCALGVWSTVGGGYGHSACRFGSTVGGGLGNCSYESFSTISGGCCNNAGEFSSVGGGNQNSAGHFSTISGGLCNTTSARYSSIGGGCCNITNARHSRIGGGHRNIIQSPTNQCCSRGATIGGGIGHNSSGGTLDATTGDLTGAISCCNAGAFSTISGGLRNCATGACSTVGGGTSNTTSSCYATIGGGQNNIASESYSTVSGGGSNTASAPRSTIGGGRINTASGNYSTISGGTCNTTSGFHSTVSGGNCNTASGCASSVNGGYSNTASATYSTVGGGRTNTSSGGLSTVSGGDCNTASGSFSTVSGGCCNITNARHSRIGGGHRNIIQSPTNQCCSRGATIGGGVGHNTSGGTLDANTGDLTGAISCCNAGAFSTISGGLRNRATGAYSTVSGGIFNTASGAYSTVAGGIGNTASGGFATISGGWNSVASGDCSTVGGGMANCATATHATVSGGCVNTASAVNSTVSGGCCNITNARHSRIGGGHRNIIQSPTNECCSRGATIGGGVGHNTSGGTLDATTGDLTGVISCCNAGAFSTISGGLRNRATGVYSTVSGGSVNIASGHNSTVSGGQNNTASGYSSIVSGGTANTASYNHSIISGGYGNTNSGKYSFIGNGRNNTASSYYTFISGGARAKTTRWGETSHAAGCFAADGDAQHTVLIARRNTTDATVNVPLFLDGSGTALTTTRLTIPASTAWTFSIKLSAYNNTDNQAAWWIFRGGIRRNAANGTALVGSLIVENDSESTLSTASATVVADDTNEALEIRVTGVAAKDIRWVAVADISQVSWGTP